MNVWDGRVCWDRQKEARVAVVDGLSTGLK